VHEGPLAGAELFDFLSANLTKIKEIDGYQMGRGAVDLPFLAIRQLHQFSLITIKKLQLLSPNTQKLKKIIKGCQREAWKGQHDPLQK